MKTFKRPLGVLATLIAMSGPSHAAEYQRLKTDWACATLRLDLRERASPNEEARDWSHGSWRLLEVVRAIQTQPRRSRCVDDSELADLRQHVRIIEAGPARTEEDSTSLPFRLRAPK